MSRDRAIVEAEHENNPRQLKPNFSRSRCILYVEDDPLIIDTGKLILECLGYKVVVVTCCNEAIRLLKEQPEKFDLVITDMSLPDMDGIDLSRRLLEIKPDIPVILNTGFNTGKYEQRIKDAGIRAVIPKPCKMEDMDRIIGRVIC
jgi:CheY-like chemotaxis protein